MEISVTSKYCHHTIFRYVSQASLLNAFDKVDYTRYVVCDPGDDAWRSHI